jgi:putative transposase
MHRPIEGIIKTCTLRKNATGDWDVSFSCEVEVQPKPQKTEAIGIDLGLTHFATLSDRQEIPNPRFFQSGQKALAKAQRKLGKLEKGAKERRKKGKVVAKVHEKIRNQRKDFCHKESKKIIDQYQYICVEDLAIKKMVEKSHFAKSITDASWSQFLQYLTYKAAEAGRKLGLVNPAYTTQDCSRCNHRGEKKLSERMHCCTQCGYTTTRDHNSAEKVLALGLDSLGEIPRSFRL